MVDNSHHGWPAIWFLFESILIRIVLCMLLVLRMLLRTRMFILVNDYKIRRTVWMRVLAGLPIV